MAKSLEAAPAAELAAFMRAHRAGILEEWAAAAAPQGAAKGLSKPALLDHVPGILDALTAFLESDAPDAPLPEAKATAHATERLAEGFDLSETVTEYALLREIVLRRWARELPVRPLEPVRAFGAALDRIVAVTVRMQAAHRNARYTTELEDRARQQETLAELGARALASDDVNALLGLVAERVATVLGADLAMIGELVGGRLRMRAGWGWREGTVGRAELPLFPDSLAGLALDRHAPAVVEDVRAEAAQRFAPVVAEHGAVSGVSVPLEHGAQRGVLSVFARAPRRFRTFDVQFLGAAGSMAAAARRGEEQLRFLSEAGTVLAGSLDARRTAQQLTDLAVPRIADWCMLDLVDAAGTVAIAALSSDDPDQVRTERVLEYRVTHPLRADAPYGLATVLASGESMLIREVTSRLLLRIAPDEQYVRWILDAGILSLLAVPLRGAKRTLGVLSFGTTRAAGRLLGEEERAVAEALAARAALAIENAALYEEAQRAIRLREDVLAVVSHDLKTPLQSILLSAQFLAEEAAGDPDARRRAASIGRAALRATAQLRDLLDMASIQAGRLAVHLEPADASEIAMEALELQLPAAQARGVTMLREGSAGAVLADRQRLVQVLGNLLGNALKFSPPASAVRLRLAEVPDGVRIAVIDAGPGIPPEDLPRIFDAYWSARRDPGAPAERGAGLGLFIAKGILEAHGARLEVESAPGRGSTFAFTLRRA
ncbi:MAG TPA: ATP-binding protein [Anaeromyxobacteraceae bacterium]|jgi:signal transduction histidine kinase|nr:ATP-binding protein [Anaeromyxobacteraceae bacterium]